jgi:hypothetical protein
MYELAAYSIGAIALFIELLAAASLIFGGKRVPITFLLISMSKVALDYERTTFSPNGHCIPFFTYLQAFVRDDLPLS